MCHDIHVALQHQAGVDLHCSEELLFSALRVAFLELKQSNTQKKKKLHGYRDSMRPRI